MNERNRDEPGLRPESVEADDGAEEVELDAEATDDPEALMAEAVRAVEEAARKKGNSRSRPIEDPSDEELVAQLEAEIADLRDRSIRTLADFDNYRKRMEREKEELSRYAAAELLRSLLPVVDNLERALSSGGSAEDLKAGVEMILRQTHDLLRRHGVSPVAAAGERFDPAVHEAVTREEDPEVEVPTVAAELQRGYRLGERLLRPAMVRVSVPVEGEDARRQEKEGARH